VRNYIDWFTIISSILDFFYCICIILLHSNVQTLTCIRLCNLLYEMSVSQLSTFLIPGTWIITRVKSLIIKSWEIIMFINIIISQLLMINKMFVKAKCLFLLYRAVKWYIKFKKIYTCYIFLKIYTTIMHNGKSKLCMLKKVVEEISSLNRFVCQDSPRVIESIGEKRWLRICILSYEYVVIVCVVQCSVCRPTCNFIALSLYANVSSAEKLIVFYEPSCLHKSHSVSARIVL